MFKRHVIAHVCTVPNPEVTENVTKHVTKRVTWAVQGALTCTLLTCTRARNGTPTWNGHRPYWWSLFFCIWCKKYRGRWEGGIAHLSAGCSASKRGNLLDPSPTCDLSCMYSTWIWLRSLISCFARRWLSCATCSMEATSFCKQWFSCFCS